MDRLRELGVKKLAIFTGDRLSVASRPVPADALR